MTRFEPDITNFTQLYSLYVCLTFFKGHDEKNVLKSELFPSRTAELFAGISASGFLPQTKVLVDEFLEEMN